MKKAARPLAHLSGSILALVVSGCADTDAPSATEGTDSAVRPEAEYLVAAAPEGWREMAHTNSGGIRITEFAPSNPRDAEDGETLRFESLTGDPLPDPIEFLTTMGDDVGAGCEGFNHYNTFSGLENNYPTSVRLFVCDRDPATDRGEMTLIKAIRGNDYFYVITRTRQITAPDEGGNASPVPEGEMAAWSLYMRGIKVCDPRTEEHPCPETNRPDADSPESDGEVDNSAIAEVTVLLVDSNRAADLVIHHVSTRDLAGWRRPHDLQGRLHLSSRGGS